MADFVKLSGKDGKSAYEIWLEQGNSGTEQDFLNSLKGEKGEKGDRGLKGDTGESTKWTTWPDKPISSTANEGDLTLVTIDGGPEGGKKGDVYIFTNGAWRLQANIKGPQGEQGLKGEDGIGIARIEKTSTNGNVDTYTITFSNGELTTFTVTNGKDGANGQDGVSPTVSVSKSGKVTTITITDKNGTKTATVNDGADGANGKDGTNGKDGYTPIKGVDYYTEEDKSEFSEYIASELAKRGQLKLEFVDSIEECTDTTKMYVLPDGFIYAYMYTEKPAYTNVLTTAVDIDNTPYNGGLGYKEGYRHSTSSGEIANVGTDVTGYIPIRLREDGTVPTIRFKNIELNIAGPGTVIPFGEYDGNDKAVGIGTLYTNGDVYGKNRFDENGVYTLTHNDLSQWGNILLRYFRITANNIDSSSIITIDEEINDELVKKYAWTNTGRAFVPADYESRIVDLEKNVAKNETEIDTLKNEIKNGTHSVQSEIPEVILPSKLYGVVGHEFVLYYDNILRCMIPEDFVVSTVFANSSDNILSLYPQFDRMLKFTPTADQVGTHDITIKVINRRTWETVATKDSSIIIVADTTLTNKKVLFIGDSLTQDSTYVAEIERMTSKGITSIGTVHSKRSFNGGVAEVNHEGRSGWGSYDYMNDYTGNGFTNPFYNPNTEYSLTLDKKYADGVLYRLTVDNSGDNTVLKHHFDFNYYLTNNPSVGTPDAVFINLGTNGGNLYAIEAVYIAFDAMIERIRAYSSNIPILLHLFPPCSRRGDGQRENNGVRNTRKDFDTRMGYYDCIKMLIERYENNPNVILVPTYLMLDTLYDFKIETVPVSARNSIEVAIGQTDNGHPAVAGYLHMADSYYNALQYVWGK